MVRVVLRSLCWLVIVMTVALNVWSIVGRQIAAGSVPEETEIQWHTPPRMVRLESLAAPPIDPTSSVAMIEFADFQCPFCAAVAHDVLPRVQAEFVKTGAVRHLFFNLPLTAIHPLALSAAQAGGCADLQGRFYDMYNQLFAANTRFVETSFLTFARSLRLDEASFTRCLDGPTLPRIRQQIADAQALGITSTPTFLFGRFLADGKFEIIATLQGAREYSVFQRILESIIVQKR